MDFLIKNTKGLTLKTKGKYCTEDLVIEIDPSLVEGYMEIDELPEVGLPRVLYKLMLEEPEYYIWENDEWVKISGSDPNLQEKEITENGEYVADEGYDGFSKVTVNVESGGSAIVTKPIEWKGTVVPQNSNLVEKVYFNANLSIEEVDSILATLDYSEYQQMYYIFVYDDTVANDRLSLIVLNAAVASQGAVNGYGIGVLSGDNTSIEVIYASNEMCLYLLTQAGMTITNNAQVGWNIIEKTIGYRVFDSGSTATFDNYKLSSVVSVTPFTKEAKEIVTLNGEYDGSTLQLENATEINVKSLLENKKLPQTIKIKGDDVNLIARTLKHYSNDLVEKVGDYAFYHCVSLKSVDLQNALEIGKYAFDWCFKLKIVNLPNVKTIITSFVNCYILETVKIPKIEKIHGEAFGGCYSLKAVVIEQTNKVCELPNTATTTFQNCYHFDGTVDAKYNPNGDKDGYIYVPDSLVDSYKADTNWSYLSDQIKPLSEYVEE